MEINLSQRVKDLCRDKGITMKELAKKMKIAPESLSRAINGNPQLSTLKSVADSLNVSTSDLFMKRSQSEFMAVVEYQGIFKRFDDIEELWRYVDSIKKHRQDHNLAC